MEKVCHTVQRERIGRCSSPSPRPWARNVCDAWPVRRQTYGYVPSRKDQIILLKYMGAGKTYLGNGTRQAYCYHGSLTWRHLTSKSDDLEWTWKVGRKKYYYLYIHSHRLAFDRQQPDSTRPILGKACFLRVSHVPIPSGGTLVHPKFCWTRPPHLCLNLERPNSVYKIRVEGVFQGVRYAPSQGGRARALPQFLGSPYLWPYRLT